MYKVIKKKKNEKWKTNIAANFLVNSNNQKQRLLINARNKKRKKKENDR